MGSASQGLQPALLIRNGRVIDPARGVDEVADLLIRDGRIVAAPRGLDEPEAEYIDASGKIVCPGLVDIHVHLREPGETHKETIETGTRAAVAGGFTTVCCMPNTQPRLYSREVVEALYREIAERAVCHVCVIGWAGATGYEGSHDLLALAEAGCVAMSDDGDPINDRAMLREVLGRCASADVPFVAHCEWRTEANAGWAVNAGRTAAELGVRGIDGEAEQRAARHVIVAAVESGARVHIAHVSAYQTAEVVREAKARGVAVTAEATPHHLLLTEAEVPELGADAKMSPPLRSAKDRAAVLEGLVDGTIDVIATDHAPHAADEKAGGLAEAPMGVVGLETCVGLVWDRLVHGGILTEDEAIAALTVGPARCLRLPTPTLAPGGRADVTIIDPDAEWMVEPERFESMGRSTPFAGWRLRGRPNATIVGGRIRMIAGQIRQ